MSARKTKIIIFVNSKAASTKILTKHVSKHIDALNKVIHLEIVRVTEKNVAQIKQMGVTRTPTLLYKNKKYVSLEKIIQILTPPKHTKESFGLDIGSPDELIHKYHDGVINAQDDDDEDDPRISREDDIRRKMTAFQKRRPEMLGVEKIRKIKGGRKVVARTVKSKFRNDNEFRQAAGIDGQEETPRKQYFDDQDGESILEDYYNAEADRMGRKPNHKPIRWSH
jgi:hypothetical protein